VCEFVRWQKSRVTGRPDGQVILGVPQRAGGRPNGMVSRSNL
jgi:hypothetical protein